MLPLLFLVTDPRYPDADLERVVLEVAGALSRGALGIHLRDKTRVRRELRPLAARLAALSRAHEALFVVNGDVELATEVGADGVHLGGDAPPIAAAREAFPDGWISVAAHSDEDVGRAVASGASAVFVSPIFPTPGKGPARGIGVLESAARLARGRLAVYALGGIDVSRARACREAGAEGVAVIRALLEATDPALTAQAIVEELETRAPFARFD
jgi:thiamine-phosphate pyrophosphorylase